MNATRSARSRPQRLAGKSRGGSLDKRGIGIVSSSFGARLNVGRASLPTFKKVACAASSQPPAIATGQPIGGRKPFASAEATPG